MERKKMGFILILNIGLLLCLAGWVLAGPQGEPGCMEVNSVLFGGKCAPDVDDGPYGHGEAATNSGDGILDGSGFDVQNGSNGSSLGEGNGGPAPNSGDGDPDGSGF